MSRVLFFSLIRLAMNVYRSNYFPSFTGGIQTVCRSRKYMGIDARIFAGVPRIYRVQSSATIFAGNIINNMYFRKIGRRYFLVEKKKIKITYLFTEPNERYLSTVGYNTAISRTLWSI